MNVRFLIGFRDAIFEGVRVVYERDRFATLPITSGQDDAAAVRCLDDVSLMWMLGGTVRWGAICQQCNGSPVYSYSAYPFSVGLPQLAIMAVEYCCRSLFIGYLFHHKNCQRVRKPLVLTHGYNKRPTSFWTSELFPNLFTYENHRHRGKIYPSIYRE